MAFTRDQLEQEFVCPKCHGRGAQVQELQLGRSAIVIPVTSGRFLAASCGLCGFTEFYNMAALVKADQAEGLPAAQLAADKAD